MLPNRISAAMSKEDRDELMAAIQTIKEKLPFMVMLSKKEIKNLPKAGAKARDFAHKALQVAEQNPDILPRGFDIEEMRKDVELFDQFEPVYLALQQLMEAVESTHTLLRAEAYSAGLLVYLQTRALGKTMGLEAASDMLGELFARKIKTSPAPEGAKS